MILDINNGEISNLLSKAAKNIEINSVGLETCNGKEQAHRLLSCLFQSFPDLFIDPLTFLSNDDKDGIIMSEVNLQGRQMGWLNGNPPHGKKFSINSVLVFEFDEYMKVKIIRIYYDLRLIYRQLEILKF